MRSAGRCRAWMILPFLLISASGCSNTPTGGETQVDSQSEGILSPAQYQAEYEAAVANFPERLPEGFKFVESPPVLEGEIASSLGTSSAYFQWYCVWAEVYLTVPDPGQKNMAMEELRKYPTTEWATQHFEDPDGVWEKMLDAAELGDPSELKTMSSSDCEPYDR